MHPDDEPQRADATSEPAATPLAESRGSAALRLPNTATTDHDSPWKEALAYYFPEFLALLFPLIHAEVDWGRPPIFMDKELQQVVRDAEAGRRYADKLVRVHTRDGTETWVLVHVEVQGERESGFAARMYQYHYRLLDRYGVDVVSLAVLADKTTSFRPETYRRQRWGCAVEFSFPMAKLLDYLDDERWAVLEQSDNPFASVVMAQLRAKLTSDVDERADWKFWLVRHLYHRGYGEADILELLRIIDWMVTLPPDLEASFKVRVRAMDEENAMRYITTFERTAIEEGVQLGLEQGLEQGLERGFVKGEAMILCRLLARRFGPLPEWAEDRLETASSEQLQAWADAVLDAPSLAGVLGLGE